MVEGKRKRVLYSLSFYHKIALIERPDNHPLSSANSATYNSNANPGIRSAAADFTSQSGEKNGNQFQSAIRFGYENRSGGTIRSHTLTSRINNF